MHTYTYGLYVDEGTDLVHRLSDQPTGEAGVKVPRVFLFFVFSLLPERTRARLFGIAARVGVVT